MQVLRLLHSFIKERKERNPAVEVSVATKFAALPWRLGRQSVISALKDSLSRLELSTVDLYQLHWPGIWGNEEKRLQDAYEKLKKRGIPLASNQVNYSLIYRAPEQNGRKAACDELGVTLIAYSPIAQGGFELVNSSRKCRAYSRSQERGAGWEFSGALGWRLAEEEVNELRTLALEIKPVIGFGSKSCRLEETELCSGTR